MFHLIVVLLNVYCCVAEYGKRRTTSDSSLPPKLGGWHVSNVSQVASEDARTVPSMRLMEQSKLHFRPDVVVGDRANQEGLHTVVFARKQKNMKYLEALLHNVSDPRSPQYGMHLSKSQVAQITAYPRASAQIRSFLLSHQIQVLNSSLYDDYISAVAPVAKWESIFRTTFYELTHRPVEEEEEEEPHESYKRKTHRPQSALPVGPRKFIRALEYSLPNVLANYVESVFNTVQLPDSKHSLFHLSPVTTGSSDSASTTATSSSSSSAAAAAAAVSHAHLESYDHLSMKRTTSKSRRTGASISSSDTQIHDNVATSTTTATTTSTSTTTTSANTTSDSDTDAGSDRIPVSSFANGFVEPSLLNSLYNIQDNTATKQSSQAIYAILEQTFSPSDLTTFQDYFNLPREAISGNVGGYVSDEACVNNINNCIEANLDVQYIMSIAQNASTIFYYWTGQDVWLGWITTLASMSNPPHVFSISYGSYEYSISSSYLNAFNTEAIKLGVMGVTITAATGDDGVGGFLVRRGTLPCGYYAMFPASSPYITAVGGTMGPEDNSAEMACQSDRGSSITTGGGFSQQFSLPSWQQGQVSAYLDRVVGTSLSPASGYANSKRGYPDISALANKYPIVANGRLYLVSGTSASSPVLAGMITLVNNARLKAGKPTLGWLNPALYALYPEFVTDITSGDNRCLASGSDCCTEGFFASSGWDPVTGLGVMDFEKFKQTMLNIQYNDDGDIITQLPTTSPTVYEGRFGWAVIDGFTDTECGSSSSSSGGGGGTIVIQKGLPLQNCLVQYDANDTAQSSIEFLCNEDQGVITLKYYSDLQCSANFYIAAGVLPLGCSGALDDSIYSSLQYRCVTPNQLPLPNGEFIVQKTYETFSTCDETELASYDAWQLNHCFNNRRDGTSFRVTETTNIRYEGANCLDTEVLSTKALSPQCTPMRLLLEADAQDFLHTGVSVEYEKSVITTSAAASGILGTLTEDEVVSIFVPIGFLLLLVLGLLVFKYSRKGYLFYPTITSSSRASNGNSNSGDTP